MLADRLSRLDLRRGGVSLVAGFPGLTPVQLAEHPHRSMVARDGLNPVGPVWLLADGADFVASVPRAFRDAAVALMSNGRAILILSRRPEPGADVSEAA